MLATRLAAEEVGVVLAHRTHAPGRVGVDLVGEQRLHDREHVLGQGRSAGHPLVVVAPTMTVRAVQPRTRKQALQPPEQGLVADVHPQRDLGIAPVAAEMPLPDQHSHDQPALDVGQLPLLRLCHPTNCFTVQKNVKRPGPNSPAKVVSPYRKT